ncbi:MAG: hypothetical protein P8Y71_19380 [Pseudolabrys sp.]
MDVCFSGGRESESRDALPQEVEDTSWQALQEDDDFSTANVFAGIISEATAILEATVDKRFAVLDKKIENLDRSLRLLIEIERARSELHELEGQHNKARPANRRLESNATR